MERLRPILGKEPPKAPKEVDKVNDNELLKECVLDPEDIIEIIGVLPPPLPPSERPDKAKPPKIPEILTRGPVKSDDFIVLMDPRRSDVYIDLEKGQYSEQRMHEAQYNHLPQEVQALIKFFVRCPYTSAVADAEWQAPPKFVLHFTVLKGFSNKDYLSGIIANAAFFNEEIKFSAPSFELRNFPETLKKN